MTGIVRTTSNRATRKTTVTVGGSVAGYITALSTDEREACALRFKKYRVEMISRDNPRKLIYIDSDSLSVNVASLVEMWQAEQAA